MDKNMPVLTYPVLLSIVKEKANYYCTPLNKRVLPEGFYEMTINDLSHILDCIIHKLMEGD